MVGHVNIFDMADFAFGSWLRENALAPGQPGEGAYTPDGPAGPHPCIAAISGLTPMMFMTRVRL